jgi:hypothetical protein
MAADDRWKAEAERLKALSEDTLKLIRCVRGCVWPYPPSSGSRGDKRLSVLCAHLRVSACTWATSSLTEGPAGR